MKRLSFNFTQQLNRLRDEMSQQGIVVRYIRYQDPEDWSEVFVTLEAVKDNKVIATVSFPESDIGNLIPALREAVQKSFDNKESSESDFHLFD